jgi:hypothetical protein
MIMIMKFKIQNINFLELLFIVDKHQVDITTATLCTSKINSRVQYKDRVISNLFILGMNLAMMFGTSLMMVK